MDPKDLASLAKAAPEVVREVYGDVASGTLKQAGKLGEEIAKTIRLVLFPVQYAAALQDRLAGYLDRAVRQVPEARAVTPVESIMLPVAEKLRFQEAANPITDLYINLLSRAMDGERIGEAHPAFVGIISQLAPDEVVFLRELSKSDYTLLLKVDEAWTTPSPEQIRERLNETDMPAQLVEKSHSIIFRYPALNQPEMFYLFLEHLYHLGLVEYTNEPSNDGEYAGFAYRPITQPKLIFIKLSHFGRLFYKACVS